MKLKNDNFWQRASLNQFLSISLLFSTINYFNKSQFFPLKSQLNSIIENFLIYVSCSCFTVAVKFVMRIVFCFFMLILRTIFDKEGENGVVLGFRLGELELF